MSYLAVVKPGNINMGLRGVRDDHFVPTLGVIEEIKDSFLFHEPACKIEIGFPVLNAVFPGLVMALKFPVTIEAFQHRFENVRYGFLLKNPALRLLGEKPDFRDDFRGESGESFVAITLGKSGANSVDIPPIRVAAFARRGNS